jgi:uncharacterized protein YgiM (DUF1202 family)
LNGNQGKFDPDALALKAAMTRPNKVWRVMHRTTYVSRVPEKIGDPPEELTPHADQVPENVDANWNLITEINKHFEGSGAELDPVELGQAVDSFMKNYLSDELPWWKDIDDDSDKKIKPTYRDDLMSYMKNYLIVYPPQIGSGVQSMARPEIAASVEGAESTMGATSRELDASPSPNHYVGLLGYPIKLTEPEPVMPGSPNPMRIQWQQVGGPGIAEFAPNAQLLNPYLRFPKPGHYRLEMTVFVDHYQTTRLVEVDILDETQYILVTKDRLNLRQGPGTDHALITVLAAQEKIKLLARNHDSSWFYVRNGNMTGWVSAKWTAKPTNLQLAEVPVLENIVKFG